MEQDAIHPRSRAPRNKGNGLNLPNAVLEIKKALPGVPNKAFFLKSAANRQPEPATLTDNNPAFRQDSAVFPAVAHGEHQTHGNRSNPADKHGDNNGNF